MITKASVARLDLASALAGKRSSARPAAFYLKILRKRGEGGGGGGEARFLNLSGERWGAVAIH